MWELIDSYKTVTITGDKGYTSKHLLLQLQSEKEIQLIFLKRDKCKDPYPKWLRQYIFKVRRRIETTFLQLTEQLNVNKVLAKSLRGLMTRLRTKILAHNPCYCINMMLGKDINLGHIKELALG